MPGTEKEVKGFDIHSELKFEHFPGFAKFLLETHLDNFVKEQLFISREVEIPLLKYFENLSEEALINLSTESIAEFFECIAANNIKKYIADALEKWVSNQLPIVERDQVIAEDITLVSYIRKKTLIKFLPLYTTDLDIIIKIIDEIDQFFLKYETLCFDTFNNMQQEKINRHLHFIEKVNATVPGILFVYDLENQKEIFSNKKTEQILGFTDNENSDFIIHPDDLPVIKDHLNQLNEASDDLIKKVEFRIKNKQNEYVWMRSYQTIFTRRENGIPSQIIGISFDITPEKEISRILKQSEEQLLEAQELAKTGSYMWDMVNHDSQLTPQVYSIFEMKRGTRFNEFMNNVHPEDQEKVKKAITEALTKTGIYECEYRYLVNGKEKIIWSRGIIGHENGKPVNMKGTITDVTERHQLLQKLSENDYLFKQAQALTHIGNWSWNLKENKIGWSDELYRIYGLKPQSEEVSYERFMQLVHPEDRQLLQQQVNNSLKKKVPSDFYHRIITDDGTLKVLHAKGEVILNNKGEPVGMVGTGQDVTEEFNLQKKLKELNESLELKNKELERSNKELSSFSYVASHDLQEPLRKIKTFGSRLLESNYNNLNEEGKDSLNRMTAAAVRMQKLIEDLLAYSRTHTEDVITEEVDLNVILDELVENYKEFYPELKLEHTKMPIINGMKFQIIQLFENLISNSIKYRSEKPPKIKIKCTAVKGGEIKGLGAEESLNYYHIQFSDNGIGFESQYAYKIFELFQRLQGKAEYPGTGIGLSICKKIVENHKGFICAEGAPNLGATFNIYLPVTSGMGHSKKSRNRSK